MGNSSTSLNEVLNGLKYKYVELQEKNKKNLEVSNSFIYEKEKKI